MQQVVLTGRLGKDPEIKYFESGKIKTSFSLAVSGYDSKKKEKTTNWFNVDIWDKKAEFVGEHFKKGDSITISGELKKENYTNSAGEEKSNWKINAQNAGYDSSILTINGLVESVENRFTSENKKIQLIKLKDCGIPIAYYNENDVVAGQSVVCFCELAMNDYKPFAKAFKLDCVASNKVDKFSEVDLSDDLIGDEEIPF